MLQDMSIRRQLALARRACLDLWALGGGFGLGARDEKVEAQCKCLPHVVEKIEGTEWRGRQRSRM